MKRETLFDAAKTVAVLSGAAALALAALVTAMQLGFLKESLTADAASSGQMIFLSKLGMIFCEASLGVAFSLAALLCFVLRERLPAKIFLLLFGAMRGVLLLAMVLGNWKSSWYFILDPTGPLPGVSVLALGGIQALALLVAGFLGSPRKARS